VTSAAADLASELVPQRSSAPAPVVTGYVGVVVSLDSAVPGEVTGARVRVGDDVWPIDVLSGGFMAEALADRLGMIGKSVRVFVVNGQPEVAYTVLIRLDDGS